MAIFYPQNLIDETIACFKEEDNLDLSVETAIEYLDSLGGLFLAFADRRTSADALCVREVLEAAPSPLKSEPVFSKPEAGPRILNTKGASYSI